MTIYSKTWELTGDVIQIRTKFENITKYYVFCNDTPLNIYFKKSQALEHAERIVNTKHF